LGEKHQSVEKELSGLRRYEKAGYVMSYAFLVVIVLLGVTSFLEYVYMEPVWAIVSTSLYVVTIPLVVILVVHLQLEARKKKTTISALQQRIQSLEKTIREKHDSV
jgi:O-antigen/teichoic acid export membrane protein